MIDTCRKEYLSVLYPYIRNRIFSVINLKSEFITNISMTTEVINVFKINGFHTRYRLVINNELVILVIFKNKALFKVGVAQFLLLYFH